MDRRQFLLGCGLGSLVFLDGPSGVLSRSMAADGGNVNSAFDAVSEADALAALFGVRHATPSRRIHLSAPFTTTVPTGAQLKVRSNIVGARAIAIMVDKSEHPLAAFARLHRSKCFLSAKIHLSQTARVTAYVHTDGGVFSSSKIIKVTMGGYGMYAF